MPSMYVDIMTFVHQILNSNNIVYLITVNNTEGYAVVTIHLLMYLCVCVSAHMRAIRPVLQYFDMEGMSSR